MKMNEVRSNDLKHSLKSGIENIQKDLFLGKKNTIQTGSDSEVAMVCMSVFISAGS